MQAAARVQAAAAPATTAAPYWRHAPHRRSHHTCEQHHSRRCVAPRATSRYDLLALSNLCLDVVQEVPALPPKDDDARKELLAQLTARPPSEQHWQLGGNCNCLIVAARLGMRAGCVGHVGGDVYGRHLEAVLQRERVAPVLHIMPRPSAAAQGSSLDDTLLCFVLVDPQGQHSFVSAYDFGPWPLLQGVSQLPAHVTQALQSTASVFTNGFVFDELPLELVCSALATASQAGAAVCFDPGPRAFTMREGSRRAALDAVLDLSHVVLMTQEEALQVTGFTDEAAAAQAILSRPRAATEWCVVKMGGEGALLMTKAGEVHHAPALQVEVQDTVGCGDSFAAAVALGYSRTHDVEATLLLANAVGAATALGRGAGTNVADADTVLRLLQREASASRGASSSGSSGSSGNGNGGTSKRAVVVQNAMDMLRSSLASVGDDSSLGVGMPTQSGSSMSSSAAGAA